MTTPLPPKWNPRYVLYARTSGRTPEEQAAHDDAQPARLIPFMCWVSARAEEFCPGHTNRGVYMDNDDFGAWLERWVDERHPVHPEQLSLLEAS